MKSIIRTMLALLILASATGPALAQHSGAVPINLTLAPGQPVEITSPNDFDLVHQKLLEFNGVAVGLDPLVGIPVPFQIRFDWWDPTGNHVYSSPFNLQAGPRGTPISISMLLDFCPREVSIDFLNTSTFALVQIQGVFTHECLDDVPDVGNTALLSGMVMMTLGAVRLRARRS